MKRAAMSRSIELLLVLLLVAFTAGVVLQVKNQRLLNEILVELQRREPVAVTDASPAHPVTAPSTKPTGDKPKVNLLNPAPGVTPPTDPTATNPVTPADPAPPAPADPETTPPPTPTDPSTPTTDEVPVTPTDPVTTGDSPQWQQHAAIVESVVAQLLAGKYDEVIARLDPPMKASLTRDQLAAAFDPITKAHGGFKRLVGHGVVPEGTTAAMTVFAIDAELTDGFIQSLTLWIDAKQRIGGLLLGKPGDAG